MDTAKFSPRVIERPVCKKIYRECLEAGLSHTAARVVAGRLRREVLPEDAIAPRVLNPRLRDLDPPVGLPDIELAAERVVLAILSGESIGVFTDHDVDGTTAHAVLVRALRDYFGCPAKQVKSYIGHRLKEGYGLSAPVVARFLDDPDRPSLLITADNGSSDEPRIAELARAGVDVIVTDHHELPVEGPPASAFACVSPARKDSKYPDSMIAGCMVAWLLLCEVRRLLIQYEYLPSNAPSLVGLLDYVALGTTADCVSLARSHNNRAVVRFGLSRIAQRTRPCWESAAGWFGEGSLTSQDIAFSLAPRIAARGRLDEAMTGVRYLLATDTSESDQLAVLLDEENESRKSIERDLLATALEIAGRKMQSRCAALVIWLPDGHAGVHGIVASRLVERFGRPTICLSPKQGSDHLVSGSVRTIEGCHVREALQAVHDACPGLLLAFGGHAGAGGLSLERSGLSQLEAAFEDAVRMQLADKQLGPVIETDGELPESPSLTLWSELSALEPFGREFPPPCFTGHMRVNRVRPVGDGTHLQLQLEDLFGQAHGAIWFKARESSSDEIPVSAGDKVLAVFELDNNIFRGCARLQLRIKHLTGA